MFVKSAFNDLNEQSVLTLKRISDCLAKTQKALATKIR